MIIVQSITLLFILGIVILILYFIFGWRRIVKRMVKKIGTIIYSDSYEENLIELIPGLRHVGIQNAFENSLRGETGEVLNRPLGTARDWPHLESLTFLPAQVQSFPIDSDEEVDVKVTIGPKAKKPLEIDIPLLVGAMAYGIALSEQARLALVEAAQKSNTAISTGEGVVLPEELKIGAKMILQFSKTEWSKEEKLLKQADMIEIKLGQGAKMGMGSKIQPENLTGRARELMGLEEGEVAQIYEHFFDNQTLDDLKSLVDELRKLTGGVPIGVKIAAGGKLEEDLDGILDLGVDFISIDGGQAATQASPAILSDSFGIPTFHAVVRAVNHLEKRKMKEKVSLIISGGLFTPRDFLKIIALGADAVYLGTALLFTVAHDQTLDALPFEPPTQVVWHEGKYADQFDQEKGTKSAVNFLNSSVEEMKVALRAMGKKSLQEVSKQDIVSFDESVAKKLDVPYTFDPWDKEDEGEKSSQTTTR